MAYDIRNHLYTNYGTNYNNDRFAEKGKDEWATIRESDSPNRCLLQFEPYLWKFDLFVSQRFLHSDAQGMSHPIPQWGNR
jgi:hypothetical protein